jgi:hypothetical protein
MRLPYRNKQVINIMDFAGLGYSSSSPPPQRILYIQNVNANVKLPSKPDRRPNRWTMPPALFCLQNLQI